jgi:DNA-binding winged helix-turn-helix (wHTH) protein
MINGGKKDMAVTVDEPVALGPFTVDLATARLRRNGACIELRPQAFRVLKVLLQNPAHLVDFNQMIRDAWDGDLVSRHTVAVTVNEIKSALGEYGDWITCRPKLGYCLEIPESEQLIRVGWHFRNQFSPAGFVNALNCFAQAAQKDSADFRAFEAIASLRLLQAAFLIGDPGDLYRLFLDALNKAVALRGWTTELRIDHAYGLFIFEGKIERAETDLLAVRRENPSYPEASVRLALLAAARGRLDEALDLNQHALATDVLLPPIAFVDTVLHLFRREFPLAAACGKKSIDLHPSSPFGRVYYAEALEHLGQGDEAIKHYRLAHAISPEIPWIRAQGARFLAKVGQIKEARETLGELEKLRASEHVDAYHMALLLHALGKRDAAFAELERAYEEKSYMVLLIDVDPKADPLRKCAGFSRFRDKVMRSAG